MIRVSREPGDITLVTIERPESRNAVDRTTADALADAFRDFENDESSPVAVLTGAGGHFCAGADLKAVHEGRAHLLPTACRLTFVKAAGKALEGFMPILGSDDGPDGDQLVHVACQSRQQLANFNTGHTGLDGVEFTANLADRLHLQIIHVLMGRSSRHVYHDHRLVPQPTALNSLGCCFLCCQYLRQRQATHREPPHLYKGTPRKPVTKTWPALIAEEVQHVRNCNKKLRPRKSVL